MHRTIEAEIDEQGQIRLLEKINLPNSCRVFVTILDPTSSTEPADTAMLSEPALAEDWNRPEEDAAWSHLQQVQSS